MTAHYDTIDPAHAQRPLFLGLDIGGTNIKLGVVDDRGRVLAKTSIPTEEPRGPQEAIVRTQAAAAELLAGLGFKVSDLSAVGIGCPGTMDIPKGRTLEPHNLPHWWNFPVRERVSHAFGLPASFANDANAAAYGEFWVGSGKAYHSLVLLTIGTGLGGGIIIGDLSVDGENSCGSECGHIIIDCNPTARLCPCGQPGHLEGYVSATALVKRTKELLAGGRPSVLASPSDAGETLSAKRIAEAAEGQDPLAREVIFEMARYLGFGVVSLMHTIDPGAVILGGAVNFGGHDAPLGREFLTAVREVVKQHAFPIPAQRTTIDFALLEGDAGFIGAAGIARLEFHRQRG